MWADREDLLHELAGTACSRAIYRDISMREQYECMRHSSKTEKMAVICYATASKQHSAGTPVAHSSVAL